jgi:hypothetical protein
MKSIHLIEGVKLEFVNKNESKSCKSYGVNICWRFYIPRRPLRFKEDDISSVKVFVVLICKQSIETIRSIINDYD